MFGWEKDFFLTKKKKKDNAEGMKNEMFVLFFIAVCPKEKNNRKRMRSGFCVLCEKRIFVNCPA